LSFSVKTRKLDGDVHVVDALGKLTIGDPVQMLRAALRDRVPEGLRKVVLNLAGVSYIDSSGLGELVCSYRELRENGGDVKLVRPTPKTRELLQITKLITIFDTFEEESIAVASFSADAETRFGK
jgi:anti-sigma B factor antagonist